MYSNLYWSRLPFLPCLLERGISTIVLLYIRGSLLICFCEQLLPCCNVCCLYWLLQCYPVRFVAYADFDMLPCLLFMLNLTMLPCCKVCWLCWLRQCYRVVRFEGLLFVVTSTILPFCKVFYLRWLWQCYLVVRFVVCVDCGLVTKNIASAHMCEKSAANQRTVDFIKVIFTHTNTKFLDVKCLYNQPSTLHFTLWSAYVLWPVKSWPKPRQLPAHHHPQICPVTPVACLCIAAVSFNLIDYL